MFACAHLCTRCKHWVMHLYFICALDRTRTFSWDECGPPLLVLRPASVTSRIAHRSPLLGPCDTKAALTAELLQKRLRCGRLREAPHLRWSGRSTRHQAFPSQEPVSFGFLLCKDQESLGHMHRMPLFDELNNRLLY